MRLPVIIPYEMYKKYMLLQKLLMKSPDEARKVPHNIVILHPFLSISTLAIGPKQEKSLGITRTLFGVATPFQDKRMKLIFW